MILSGLIVGLLVLSACGRSAPEPVDNKGSEPTAGPEVVAPAPTDTPAPAPTDTPGPEPTATPESAEITEAAEEAIAEETTAEPAADTAAEEAVTPAAEVAEAADVGRTFTIVPAESRASYIVAEEFFGGALGRFGISPGLVDTIGSTREIEGELQIKLSDPNPLVSAHFTVNIQSLTSDQSRRDNQIRRRYLESNSFPVAEFMATGLEEVPTDYAAGESVNFKVRGDMTIREITNPVTFDVTASLAGNTITGVATTGLAMTDFGFNPPSFANLFDVANEFRVEVEFTLVETQ
jgi:polyisoprenoid-binding protein YceI